MCWCDLKPGDVISWTDYGGQLKELSVLLCGKEQVVWLNLISDYQDSAEIEVTPAPNLSDAAIARWEVLV